MGERDSQAVKFLCVIQTQYGITVQPNTESRGFTEYKDALEWMLYRVNTLGGSIHATLTTLMLEDNIDGTERLEEFTLVTTPESPIWGIIIDCEVRNYGP